MINNPTDSVCDYLAELLYEEDRPQPPVVKTKVDVPVRIQPRSVHVPAEEPKIKANTERVKTATPDLVAAPSFDKEKLAKLLRSAPLKIQSEPVVEVIVAAEPVEPDSVAAEVTPAQSLDVSVEPDVVEEVEPQTEIAWCENGRPSWAQERFDVLLFKVHGLTLAVPLIALGQIQPITDELTPIFGQAKWFMGLQPTPMGQIKTVNTALFVMPERYDPAFLESAKYVVSIDGLNWGLAVDSVQQPKTLDPDDVKWRQGRGLRPWLAGTIKEHMCALIDVPNMGVILNASDKNTKKT